MVAVVRVGLQAEVSGVHSEHRMAAAEAKNVSDPNKLLLLQPFNQPTERPK